MKMFDTVCSDWLFVSTIILIIIVYAIIEVVDVGMGNDTELKKGGQELGVKRDE